MTKSDLVQLLSRRSQLPRGVAEIIVDTIIRSLIEALDAGEKVELRGFGSFRMKTREARMGRNPKTGVKVHVPKRRVPAFHPGKELLETVNHSAPYTPE
jgi:integration host factor subunit beta